MSRAVGRPRGSRDRCGAARFVDSGVRDFVVRAFGEQIRRARESADVAADELAMAIGCHPRTIHGLEAGTRTPRLSTLVAIAMALGVPVDHLVPEV